MTTTSELIADLADWRALADKWKQYSFCTPACPRDDPEHEHGPSDFERLLSAVEAVLALHQNHNGKCSMCLTYTSPMPMPKEYPCPTVRAISAALGTEEESNDSAH